MKRRVGKGLRGIFLGVPKYPTFTSTLEKQCLAVTINKLNRNWFYLFIYVCNIYYKKKEHRNKSSLVRVCGVPCGGTRFYLKCPKPILGVGLACSLRRGTNAKYLNARYQYGGEVRSRDLRSRYGHGFSRFRETTKLDVCIFYRRKKTPPKRG